MHDYLRKLKIMESELSANEAVSVMKTAARNPAFYKSIFSKKITIDDLLSAWRKDGKPTDIDDLLIFLNEFGIPKRSVYRIFNKLDISPESGSDERVTRLAKAIVSSGIKQEVIDYLRKYRKINEASDPSHGITDAQIRSLFIKVLKATNSDQSSDTDAELVKRWISQFTSETDDDMKKTLSSEITQIMADRQDRKSIQDIKPSVISVIRKSDLPPSFKMDVIDSLQNNIVLDNTSSEPADNEAINTVKGWVSKFKNMASPVQQYPMAAGIVNYLSNLSDSPDMDYLRKYVIAALQTSGMSDARKASAISDIKNKRPYTKAQKPAKKKSKSTNPLKAQYGPSKKVRKESQEVSSEALLYIFESAILSKTQGRFKKWQPRTK